MTLINFEDMNKMCNSRVKKSIKLCLEKFHKYGAHLFYKLII